MVNSIPEILNPPSVRKSCAPDGGFQEDFALNA